MFMPSGCKDKGIRKGKNLVPFYYSFISIKENIEKQLQYKYFQGFQLVRHNYQYIFE